MFFKKKKKVSKNLLLTDALRELKGIKRKKANIENVNRLNEIMRIFLREKYKLDESLTLQELLTEFNQRSVAAQAKVEIPIALIKIYKKQYDPSKEITRKEFDDLILQAIKAIKSTKANP